MFWGGVWTCKAEAKPTKTFGIDYMQKTGGWVSEKVGNIAWAYSGGREGRTAHAHTCSAVYALMID